MSNKIIIFSVAVSVSIFCAGVVSNTYAGAAGRSMGSGGQLDFGYVPGELLVRFAPKPDGIQRNRVEKTQILSSLGAATIRKDYRIVAGLSHVKLPAGVTVEQAMAQLHKRPDVIYAQPNHYLKLCGTFPNDPQGPKPAPDGGDLWGMYNIGQTVCEAGTSGAHINAPEAWDIETDASDIIVAVIDSGVDYEHEDLEDNRWVNEEELDGTPDFDDDGNGYKDDIYGYDFCTWDNHERDSDPMDEFGHGTHIAGTIGARGNNDYGVTGVCWKVKIMALRFTEHNHPFGYVSDAIACIYYAVDMGAKVISNSWGAYYYWPQEHIALKDAIEAAGDNGVLFVAAANNHDNDIDNEEPFYPASYDLENIISVMATDCHDERSDWSYWEEMEPPWDPDPFDAFGSNYGAISVDLAAPGTCIWSCVPPKPPEYIKYKAGDGTSVATPHVSGACALIWAINPSLSHLEVKGIILSTVDVKPQLEDDPDPLIGRTCVTAGRLNVGNAAEAASDYARVFSVKNSTDERVASFDNLGNLVVKGSVSTPQAGEGQGIEGHWTMDDNDNNSNVADSEETNNGTYHGTGGEDDYTSSHDVAGEIDGALEFDGTQDYVSLGSSVVALIGDTVTISAWIRAEYSSAAYSPIVTQYDLDWYGYDLCLNSNGKPCFFLYDKAAQADTAVIVNTWYHLAGTYDGEMLRIYVDGVFKGDNDYSGMGEDTDAYIGYGIVPGEPPVNCYFKGRIDDVRVYDYAMSVGEIREVAFPDASRFRIKNSSDETVAWFDHSGYVFLEGEQKSWQGPSGENDEFIIENSGGNPKAYINDSGNLYLEGRLFEQNP